MINRKGRKVRMVQKEWYLYICDPDKNKSCTKEACFQNGGPCDRTTDARYARVGTMPVKAKRWVEEEVKDDSTGQSD